SAAAATSAPPLVSGTPPTSVNAGAKYEYTPQVANPEEQLFAYDISNKPDWAVFDDTTGELSGIPQVSDVGTSAEIEIGVSNGTSRAVIGPFRITVKPQAITPPVTPTAPPTIAGSPAATVTAGQSYQFIPTVTDPSGAALSFAIVNRPAWATFSTATGQLSGTPTSANVGAFANILISVSDGNETLVLPAFSISVAAAQNDAATISGTPAATVIAGANYSFTPSATDPDGRALTFSIQNAPSWSSFSASTGQLSGTPHTNDVGSFANIAITVSDGTLTAALPAFAIQVRAPVDNAPTITGTPATSVVVGTNYLFTPVATDPDGKPIRFSIQGQPSWASFSTATGQLSGTPTSANVGSFTNIVITVSDSSLTASLPAFAILVQAQPDHAPLISGTPPASVVAGASYSFKPTASDPEGNALTFSIANQPSWASFNANTGRLSGTPAKAEVGIFANIVISVGDGTFTSSLAAFSIDVEAPADAAPVISGTPATSVVAGTAYLFRPTASDPDGNSLTFSVANLPSWASFAPGSGLISGTPSTANVGSFGNLVITVSDGTLQSSLPGFTITVTSPANPPPTIGGTPATTVNAGSAYSFTPTASDPNHNALTFSIDNPPGWASFNAQTGQLSGTPAAGDVGSYANISIRVSDGTSTASLAPFSITVTQAANGSVTLNWIAPTQNTDGSPLTNLAGYHIYYGTSANNLNQSLVVANPGLTTYVLGNLAAGTWYFAVNDYTSTAVESAVSNVVSKAIP
ncbi:MAG TPA: putative Ig domain-containing protein, partial [Steroidobacteraceae bacterium]